MRIIENYLIYHHCSATKAYICRYSMIYKLCSAAMKKFLKYIYLGYKRNGNKNEFIFSFICPYPMFFNLNRFANLMMPNC